MKHLHRYLLALSVLCSAPGMAQQLLPLDEAAEHRLGLVFMRLAETGQQSGAVLPAMVISSPFQQSGLVALFDGVVTEWKVAPGEEVSAGSLLGLVRSPEVLALQQQWLTSLAQERQSSAQLTRDKQLFADGVIAEQRLQQTEREQRSATIAAQSAAAQLESAGFDSAARAALAGNQSDLGYYRLLATTSGRVAHLVRLPGDAVDAGAELVSINSSVLWVSAELPARSAASLVVGQSLQVQGQAAALTLRQKDQALDRQSQTVGILAEFAQAVDLLPGQVVDLVLPAPTQGVVIPADAVVRTGEQTAVYVKTSGGVESRVLDLQPFGSDYLAIAGIDAGAEVVVRGAALLKGIQLGLGGE